MPALLLLLTFLLPTESVTEEIIGGHEAEPHSRPYMAFLSYKAEDSKNICGGVLVQEEFVLTAAHCTGSSMKVILGAHDIRKREKTQQVFQLRKAIPHPHYNTTTFSNDIMLLQLEKKATLTEAVQLLSLPDGNSQVKPGDLCQVAGWGQLAPNGSFPSTLNEVEMIVQKKDVCQPLYPRTFNPAMELCVGDPKIRKTSFNGDSGGPLLCSDVFEAIVRSGEREEGLTPSIFTKVPPFLQWIKDTMKQHRTQRTN